MGFLVWFVFLCVMVYCLLAGTNLWDLAFNISKFDLAVLVLDFGDAFCFFLSCGLCSTG